MRGPPDFSLIHPVALRHAGVSACFWRGPAHAVFKCRTLSDQNDIFYEQSRRPILVARRKTMTTSALPALFISHGSPDTVIADTKAAKWMKQLADGSAAAACHCRRKCTFRGPGSAWPYPPIPIA
jgi:hypothetical protein